MVAWRVENVGSDPLALLGARLPHDRFYAKESELSPELALLPGASELLNVEASCSELAGAAIENAFLILRLRQGVERWLVFARLRVNVDEHGTPAPVVERVSAQRIAS
jgi:hypothetical protein